MIDSVRNIKPNKIHKMYKKKLHKTNNNMDNVALHIISMNHLKKQSTHNFQEHIHFFHNRPYVGL